MTEKEAPNKESKGYIHILVGDPLTRFYAYMENEIANKKATQHRVQRTVCPHEFVAVQGHPKFKYCGLCGEMHRR